MVEVELLFPEILQRVSDNGAESFVARVCWMKMRNPQPLNKEQAGVEEASWMERRRVASLKEPHSDEVDNNKHCCVVLCCVVRSFVEEVWVNV